MSEVRAPRFPARGVVAALIAAAVLLVASDTARGEEPHVEAFIRPQQGITDTDPVTLVIRATGTRQPPAARLTGLKNLKVIGGPNTASEVTWVQGRTTMITRLSYVLLAEGPGEAEIPALDVILAGKTYRTEPIRFTVAEAPAGRPQARPGPSRPRAQAGLAPDDLFLEARLGADEAWVGQPVPLSVALFTGVRISNLDWRELPSFSSFWVEEDDVNPEAESYRTTVEGRRYVVYPLDRRVLVPIGPGELTIDPYVLQVDVRTSSGGMFSLGRTQTVIRKSEPRTLRVRALPAQGRPEDFAGAVGEFRMTVALDREEAEIDEAVSLKVTIEGDGFLKSVQPPELDAPPDLKIFPPKASQSLSIRAGKMVSRKTWEWVVIPLAAGELRLPAIRFPYFDPTAERYRIAESDVLMLAVRRGDDTGVGRLVRGEVREQRRDIAFIKPLRGTLRENSPRIHRRPAFVTLAVLPLLLTPLAIVAGRWRHRLQRDQGLARGRKARARARKRLAAAGKRLRDPDTGTFHEQVALTLVEYLADRFNLAAAGLTYDRLDELMASRGVDTELRRRFRSCMETCDFARFVPASGQPERRREVLVEATSLVERLDRQL